MYDPIRDGVDKTTSSVRFTLERPPAHLSGLVQWFTGAKLVVSNPVTEKISHYIHSFRKITGYTPAKFIHKFNV